MSRPCLPLLLLLLGASSPAFAANPSEALQQQISELTRAVRELETQFAQTSQAAQHHWLGVIDPVASVDDSPHVASAFTQPVVPRMNYNILSAEYEFNLSQPRLKLGWWSDLWIETFEDRFPHCTMGAPPSVVPGASLRFGLIDATPDRQICGLPARLDMPDMDIYATDTPFADGPCLYVPDLRTTARWSPCERATSEMNRAAWERWHEKVRRERLAYFGFCSTF